MRNFEKIEAFIKDICEFEGIINYNFKNLSHLLLALTHSSYANENRDVKLKSNERLEFLGDSILNAIISEKIFMDYKELTEGELTKVRASIVCEQSLLKCANDLELGRYLLLGKGEEMTGGRNRVSILSDAVEALIGSIYIDGGMKAAKSFIIKHMSKIIEDSVTGVIFTDYKSELQEIVQRNSEDRIQYEIIEEKGPDHNKLFVAQVKISENVMGTGEGKTKKEAEQHAARTAINRLKQQDNMR